MDSLAFLKTVKPPDFRRGTGPDALPQGAAASLQRSSQASQAAVAQSQSQAPVSGGNGAPGAPTGQQMASAPTVIDRGSTEDMKYLLGPTDRPGEPVHAGLTASLNPRPPENLLQLLGAFRDAANLPNASTALQAFYQTLVHLSNKA